MDLRILQGERFIDVARLLIADYELIMISIVHLRRISHASDMSLNAWITLMPLCSSHAQIPVAEPDHWSPLHRIVGEWVGSGKGIGGTSTTSHTYEFLFKGKFLHSRTFSQFESDDPETLGEIHEDWGFFSHDPDLGKIIFRQFLSEGYVNTYVLESAASETTDSDTLVFTSTSTEGAGGMQARLTIQFTGDDEYTMILYLARPGEEWFSCQNLVMQRKK